MGPLESHRKGIHCPRHIAHQHFRNKGGQGQESHQKEGTWPVFCSQAHVKA